MADLADGERAQQYDQETFRMALKADEGRTYARVAGTAFIVTVTLLLSSLTYCHTRPSEPSTDDLARTNCISHGGAWMPVLTVYSTDVSTKSFGKDMSCVPPTNVPQVLGQNATVMQTPIPAPAK